MAGIQRFLRRGIEAGIRPLRRIPVLERNEDFVDASLGFVFAESAEQRDQASLSFLNVVARRQLQRLAPEGLTAAKGRARDLLEVDAVANGLESTAHLGALAQLSSIRPTRLDYVSLVIAQLLQLKKSKAVTGLSSRASEWPVGTALELMQCWAVLHNWGHLFGTFATERGLLYHFDQEPGVEEEVFSIHTLHQKLRSPVRELVARRNLHQAFYALACLRASTELQKKLREDACSALAAFFEHQRRKSAEYEVYRRVRQLAYHRLHSIMRLERTCDFATAPAAVSELMEDRELRNDEHAPSPPLVALLKSFDVYQGQELFTSPHAAAYVLNHNRVLKHWWRRHSNESPADRVRALFLKPGDWPKEEPDDLKHWLRIRFPADSERWLGEVRDWSRSCGWQDGNFLVSPLQGQSLLTCDLYVNATGSGPSPDLYFGTSRMLSAKCVAAAHSTWDEDLGRSVGRLVADCLGQLVRRGFRPQLERAPSMHGAGWAVVFPGNEAAREMKRLAERVGDEKRKAELRAVVADIEQHDLGPGQLVLAVVGTTRLLDDDSGDVKKEIDGVWAVLDGRTVAWRFLEEKTRQQCGREGQLGGLQAFIHVQLTAPQRLPVNPK